MIRINEHYKNLKASYLFSDISRRVAEFAGKNPGMEIIRLGIGDVTSPLPPACVEAFHRAVEEMGDETAFRGYGPEQGYEFLREKIAENDYRSRGAAVNADEIFISDGAKCDTGNIQEIFSLDSIIAIPDPVYPVYIDTNVMAGRARENRDGRHQGVVYLDSNRENGFVPDLPKVPVDLIYLCFPNNPTGATATRAQLERWVEYAASHRALILFDAAYEAFMVDETLPRSIYEIPGADEVAIEFRSFSKTAGFTGTRCAFTVIPKKCRAFDAAGNPFLLHQLWFRRQSTKFNGVSYPVQRAAEAVYSPEGKKQTRDIIASYRRNAALVLEKMTKLGFTCTGGTNSPYIWVDCGMDSWDFFSLLLEKAGVVTTPGAGFGKCGEGYIRISAFNSYAKVEKAMERIELALGK